MSDRERIARDLHDSVIQRLFAVGLSLEATARRPAAETQERIHQAVGDIDDTIRAIRSVIFSLEAREETRPGLRAQVLGVATEAADALGFDPSVSFDGPVDTLTNEQITEHLVAVLREALAKRRCATRHASVVQITVSADGEVTLLVDDDGRGAAEFHRAGGHGVANFSERARQLGGSVSRIYPHASWHARRVGRVPVTAG